MRNVVFSAFPKQEQFINAVFSGKYKILIYGGAIRGGKTFVGLAILVMLCKMFPGSRWTIVRKSMKRLKENVRPSLDKFLSSSEIEINEQFQIFTFKNGSKILFKGENYERDKTLESFKGHETNGFLLEEISELRFMTFTKCRERAGTYIIVPTLKQGQPKPLIIGTCNPTQTWVKEEIYDKWKNGTLPKDVFYLPANADDNPYISDDVKENWKGMPTYEYEVFVKGNWDISLKVKNAFFHAFDINKHLGYADYNSKTTIHVSIDSNVMPYCAASVWQIDERKKIVFQVHEIAATDPYNHARGLAIKTKEYLDEINYNDIVYMYGDATTKNQNTIDSQKRSFFDIFIEEMQSDYNTIDYIGRSNPSVSLTGNFVNALYSGYDNWNVIISEDCKKSISDYLEAKTTMDGNILKEKETNDNGVTYERIGHFSDTKRYLLYRLLNDVFYRWQNRFSGPTSPEVINVIDEL